LQFVDLNRFSIFFSVLKILYVLLLQKIV
jgi:hypothetical protein